MSGHLAVAEVGHISGEGEKMKVLHYIYSKQWAGAENVAGQIIGMFQEDSEIEMVYCSMDGNFREILEERGISFVPVKNLTIRALRQVLKEERPDVLHVHDFRAGGIAAVAAFGLHIRLISHWHTTVPWLKKGDYRTVAILLVALLSEKVLLVSDTIGKEFRFNRFVKKKERVFLNPVDLGALKPSGKAVLESDIIFVGRLEYQKNPQRFLKIMSDLQKRMPNLRAVMIGEGILQQECEALIEQYGLQNTVKLLGFQKNPLDYMANSRIVCMTSRFEGFCMAALESLALKKPMVVSSVNGLVEIVQESCGNLCETDAEFVDALEHLLTDEGYYAEKSAGAFCRAKELHNIEEYKARLRKIYMREE